MSEHQGNEIWTEETINNGKAGLYDLQEGEEIYRYLSDWYLTKSSSPLHRRFPLPTPMQLRIHQHHRNTKDKYALHGLLLPKNPSTTPAVRFRLENFDMWAIDRSTLLRGVWVQSREAWYLLHRPLSDQPQFRVRLKTDQRQGNHICALQGDHDPPLVASLPDQATLHLELRAKFGLVSNLSDIFLFDETCSESLAWMKVYANKTPTELYKALKPTEDLRAMFPDRSDEPFDLRLLQRYPDFVKEHLEGFYEGFSDKCTFMNSLKHPTKAVFTQKEFELSALAAEKRGARAPWGEPLPPSSGMERIDPSWVMAAKRDAAAAKRKARNAEGSSRPRKRLQKENAEQTENLPLVDAVEQHHVQEASHGDEANINKRPMTDTQAEAPSLHTNKTRQAKGKGCKEGADTGTKCLDATIYSPERMNIALEDIKHVLVPTPEIQVERSLTDLRALSLELKTPDALKGILPKMRGDAVQTWEYRFLIAAVILNTLQTADADSTKVYGKKFIEQEKKRHRSSLAEIIFETWKDDAIRTIQNPNFQYSEPSLVVEYLVEAVKLIQPMTKKSIIDSRDKLEALKDKRTIDWDRGLDQISTAFDKKIQSQNGAWTDVLSAARERIQCIGEISKLNGTCDAPRVSAHEKAADEVGMSKVDAAEAERKRNASERRREKLNQSLIAKISSAAQPESSTAISNELPMDTTQEKSNSGQSGWAAPSSGWTAQAPVWAAQSSGWAAQSSRSCSATPAIPGCEAGKANRENVLRCPDAGRWGASSSWSSYTSKSTEIPDVTPDENSERPNKPFHGWGNAKVEMISTKGWGTSSSWFSHPLKSNENLHANADQLLIWSSQPGWSVTPSTWYSEGPEAAKITRTEPKAGSVPQSAAGRWEGTTSSWSQCKSTNGWLGNRSSSPRSQDLALGKPSNKVWSAACQLQRHRPTEGNAAGFPNGDQPDSNLQNVAPESKAPIESHPSSFVHDNHSQGAQQTPIHGYKILVGEPKCQDTASTNQFDDKGTVESCERYYGNAEQSKVGGRGVSSQPIFVAPLNFASRTSDASGSNHCGFSRHADATLPNESSETDWRTSHLMTSVKENKHMAELSSEGKVYLNNTQTKRRGMHMTLPAWMTRGLDQEQIQAITRDPGSISETNSSRQSDFHMKKFSLYHIEGSADGEHAFDHKLLRDGQNPCHGQEQHEGPSWHMITPAWKTWDLAENKIELLVENGSKSGEVKAIEVDRLQSGRVNRGIHRTLPAWQTRGKTEAQIQALGEESVK